ncbi:MacB family efflux pump subunit [Amphibiibacter pelophylacis]|uniref:MacB family efflux pump subunit n=1 Tax=Amphibiibacter pelophylacis TaxID=1799477 RepID=A0ACC6NYQ4_9BURK
MTAPQNDARSDGPPLLQVQALSRSYPAGDGQITVLKDVDLSIRAGEMVAIVGQSGSGKSTLMNILGCLDRPSGGSYRVAGRDTRELQPDELAELRREHFGFIFQRYHLLADLPALDNVAVPAVYAGRPAQQRHERATELLQRLGLGERTHHKPGQLSGGQQQRVSIARALMNGGRVILADEPTGALDTHSGAEVMRILQELHQAGHTLIIVTHDMAVARHAQRIIELRDGEIIADGPNPEAPALPSGTPQAAQSTPAPTGVWARWSGWRDRLGEALRMAVLAMMSHRLRTFLTMLGIIIGIASVVSVVALGAGSQQKILENISSIGTNTIDIFPGSGFGDLRSGRVRTLVAADAQALSGQPYLDSVTPVVSASSTLRAGNVALSGSVSGVGEQYFRVKGVKLALGQSFGPEEEQSLAQVAVIDDNTRQQLFPDTPDPVGQVMLVDAVPVRVVGVAAPQDSAFGPGNQLNVWLPYTTVMGRLQRRSYLSSITVRVADSVSPEAAEAGLVQLLTSRHGSEDFFVRNSDTIRQTIESTTQTMTLLISSIAVISLIVGGIGVMNIMLVSVTERTREIGVRMAVGARQADIRQQFLLEAVLVCLIGGGLGIALALALGALASSSAAQLPFVFSSTAMGAAFACSTLIGVIFGYLPASSAARLDPVDALARD